MKELPGNGRYIVGEEWLPIAGFEGKYAVSSLGRVRSYCQRMKKRGKIRMPVLNARSGYYRINLCVNYRRSFYFIHRLVAAAFIPNPDNLPEVNHKDWDRLNNKAENLEWCNRQHNIIHAMTKPGRHKSGRKSAQTTLEINKP